MTNIPHLVEVALLIIIAYLLGCVIGYFLRTRVFGDSGSNKGSSSIAANSAAQSSTGNVPPARMKKVVKAKSAPAEKETAKAKATETKTTETKTTETKTTETKTADSKAADTSAKKAPLPHVLDAPRDGSKDNLKLIKGVGPKIEEKLNKMGTFHFAQIAAWDKSTIAKVDETLSFKGRIERERWVPQAKALAKK